MELVGRSLLELVYSKDIPIITSMLSPHPQLPVVGLPTTTNDSAHAQSSSTHAQSNYSMIGSKRSFHFRLKTSKQPLFDSNKASKSRRYKQPLPGNSTVTGT